jgi:hypothetical protein
MHSSSKQPTSSLEQLKNELNRLSQEQADAYGDAVYVGMTPEFARQCDERRRKIQMLVEELVQRCQERSGPGSVDKTEASSLS